MSRTTSGKWRDVELCERCRVELLSLETDNKIKFDNAICTLCSVCFIKLKRWLKGETFNG